MGAGYFSALGIAFVAGRGFEEGDTLSSTRVALVNETFVKRFVQDGDLLGRTVRVEGAVGQPERKYEIVGVVKHTRYSDLREQIDPLVYVPSSQEEEPGRS